MKKRKVYIYAALLGCICFLLLYGTDIIDVTNINWLLSTDGFYGDLSNNYLGWKFYRKAPWSFPIGMMNNIAYPHDMSIIFTDSIPLFAIVFKILSPLLPGQFQYFGIWGMICFALTGGISSILLKRYLTPVQAVLGSLLFILAPITVFRMFFHSALGAQWIILLSFYPIIYQKEKFDNAIQCFRMWGIIGALCASIHLYFLPMCGILLLCFSLESIRITKSIRNSTASMSGFLMSALCIIYILGGFSAGVTANVGGLGTYSYNMNGLINPQGWSWILPDLEMYGSGQYEGFAYLGLGVIVLFLITSCILLRRQLMNCEQKKAGIGSSVVIYSIGSVVIFGVLALSPVITLNHSVLLEIKLSMVLSELWGIFRVSGRFIWPVVYIFMFFALCGDSRIVTKKVKTFAIILGLMIQVVDIFPHLNLIHQNFRESPAKRSRLQSELWSDKSYKHIVMTTRLAREDLYDIADYASDNGITINDFIFARTINEKIRKSINESLENLDDETIYIFADDNKAKSLEYNLNLYEIDGFIVGVKSKMKE